MAAATFTSYANLEAALTPQPYIIIRGGIVQNDPDIPVLDMDVLQDEYIDEGTVEEVRAVRALALDLRLTAIVAECNTWLEHHDPTLTTEVQS